MTLFGRRFWSDPEAKPVTLFGRRFWLDRGAKPVTLFERRFWSDPGAKRPDGAPLVPHIPGHLRLVSAWWPVAV